MGMCISKSTARSTAGSEKSDKCRWDKHGNVFFPVRRSSSDHGPAVRGSFMEKNTFSSTLNPVYAEFESPARSRRGHFSSFTKLLRSSKSSPVVEHNKHPLSPSRSSKSTSNKASCSSQQQQCVGDAKDEQQQRRHSTLKKFIEAEKISAAAASLSRSSSAKEGSLTRSSSFKEAALSRCSSQKEGKRDFAPEPPRPASEIPGTAAGLKPVNFKPGDANVDDQVPSSKPPPGSDNEETSINPAAEVKQCSSEEFTAKTSSAEGATVSFLTKGLGLPCYQPLVFRAGSPDKCRGRASSTHSSFSGEELGPVAPPRRRSPNRKSPGKRSPRKCSPVRKPGAPVSGPAFTLNSSAARFQRSLPGANAENRQTCVKPPQAPKNLKKNSQETRAALKDLPMNADKSEQQTRSHQVRRRSPVKASHSPSNGLALPKKTVIMSKRNTKTDKFAVYTDAIHVEVESGSESVTTEGKPKGSGGEEDFSGPLKEPKAGSKRLRSPKKLVSAGGRYSKEYLNFNISLPESTEERNEGSEDKHIDVQGEKKMVEDNRVLSGEEDCSPDPELLELLERTPKKLRKMALKLALMIELEHNEEQAHPEADKPRDVDLELKLGMPNTTGNKRRVGDGIRLDFSVAVDSPVRSGSISVPMTPRHSVISTCNGLSVEARIGSSKSKSDFSFHIMKNPDKLFGNAPQQLHVSRTECREETSSAFHVNAGTGNGSEKGCDQTKHEEYADCLESDKVQRCSSFGFENDAPLPRIHDADRRAPEAAEVNDPESGSPAKLIDLNRFENEFSPGFEFKLKRSSKQSSPATPVMPTAAAPKPSGETEDALSLSADEIAEIWGAFEACQEEGVCN